MPTPHQTYVTPIQTTPQHNTYLYYHSPPHQLIYITHIHVRISRYYEPIPMAYGISLSEQQQQQEQQSHPIYMALRAIIEQGTTALSKLIQVKICTNPFGIPQGFSGNKAFLAWLY